MASSGKDDNASQFFFTLYRADELNGKHTLFGKVRERDRGRERGGGEAEGERGEGEREGEEERREREVLKFSQIFRLPVQLCTT